MKKRSLGMSVAAALAVAAILAGCGTTTYFAGRTLPPSGLINRVMIAIQNPGAGSKGALQIVDAFYDIRSSYNGKTATFSISGFNGALPVTIQNMPEQQVGGVYGSGDGSFTIVNYATETVNGTASGLAGLSSSIYTTRSEAYTFAANQQANLLTVLDKSASGNYSFNLPGVYRVSVNPGGSVALAFVQNSNYVYYPVKLTSGQTIDYSGGPSAWPLGAVDCEPQNAPAWCLFQALDPSSTPANGSTPAHIVPLTFDRPVKAVFSADGGTAYILNCGPECGGKTASVSQLPVAPMLFSIGQQSGLLPTQAMVNGNTIPIPGGASNALVDSSTLYVVGQCAAATTLTSSQQPQCVAPTSNSLFTGNLSVIDLATNQVAGSVSISDGAPGAMSRMIEADDNTLWIAMTKCTNGARAALGLPYGCLTMVNISTPASPTVTLLPYIGDATGIAAITGLHKIYTAEGGQVYIYSTVDGSAIDNQYVTVTGTAYDVAYMDGQTDANNTVY